MNMDTKRIFYKPGPPNFESVQFLIHVFILKPIYTHPSTYLNWNFTYITCNYYKHQEFQGKTYKKKKKKRKCVHTFGLLYNLNILTQISLISRSVAPNNVYQAGLFGSGSLSFLAVK